MSSTLVIIFLVFGGVLALQFYKGRKLNAMLMIHYIRGFENVLKPKDKDYIYLGGTVGFKARYQLQNKFIRDVDLTLTMLPRQSFLWLPFSYVMRGGDRLYIVVSPKFRVRRDAHLIRRMFHRFGAKIKEEKDLNKENLKVNDAEFIALYKEKSDVLNLLKLLENSFDLKRVGQVSLNFENNTIYCIVKPDPQKTPRELEKFLENLPKTFENWTYFSEE
ncbi:MAG: hypothetical protein ACP5HC_03770 [Caldisericum sp.]